MSSSVKPALADDAREREGGIMFRLRMFGFVTLVIVATSAVQGQVCEDPGGECSDIPCSCANSCNDANDCAAGQDCLPFGTPGVECESSICFCDNGLWAGSDDCAPQCVAQVPAVSAWGLVAMLLLLLTTSTAVLLWRRRSAA